METVNKMYFKEKEKIFNFLDAFIKDNTLLYLWISGWPDSMFLFHLIKDFIEEKKIKKNNIKILFYDHSIRKETKEEKTFLLSYFKWYDFIIWENKTNLKQENQLRKLRYDFFKKNINSWYLLLWHNLTDRIETTLLNMCRWASKKWILNMNFYKKTKDFNILRPLIDLPKYKIQKLCDFFNIPYFIDYTNFSDNFSKRNFIRNNIINNLESISNKNENWDIMFYESLKNLYSIEESNCNFEIYSLSLPNIEWIYKWYYLYNNILDLNDFIYILDYLGIYKNTSQAMLYDFFNFFTKKDSWYKYLNWFYFFLNYWKIYIINAEKFFWNKKLYNTILIKETWKYNFFWYDLSINKYDLWGFLRFPKDSDRYKGKSLNKYFINNKIPFFIRKFTPVLEKNWEIKKIFKINIEKWQ